MRRVVVEYTYLLCVEPAMTVVFHKEYEYYLNIVLIYFYVSVNSFQSLNCPISADLALDTTDIYIENTVEI